MPVELEDILNIQNLINNDLKRIKKIILVLWGERYYKTLEIMDIIKKFKEDVKNYIKIQGNKKRNSFREEMP